MTITAIDAIRTRTATTSTPAPSAEKTTTLHAVPATTEARGFALYVGIDEYTAAAAGITLPAIVEALRATLAELVPSAGSYATVALAPRGAGGRDVDVVRQALKDPSARALRKNADESGPRGVIIDNTRNTVTINGSTVALTYKELRLLQHLISNEGRTVERTELITELWDTDEDETPNERTIDVHVRRLRAKLGTYEGIVRTVRGTGYRYDRHADVVVRAAA